MTGVQTCALPISMRRRGGRRRRKVCAFCTEADAVIDYKDVATLKKYVSERGKRCV